MNDKIDNPPAFPYDTGAGFNDDYQGMTLRDYFAGQALVGLASLASEVRSEIYAGAAYQMADAMLKERLK